MALKKINVCKDDLEVANARIDAGTDSLETVLEALKELNLYIDEDISNIIDLCNRSLEEIEYGRELIANMLNGGKWLCVKLALKKSLNH